MEGSNTITNSPILQIRVERLTSRDFAELKANRKFLSNFELLLFKVNLKEVFLRMLGKVVVFKF